MRLKLLFAALLLASMSACAPRALCPAYAVDDNSETSELTEQQKRM
jgi:hypothetical protein